MATFALSWYRPPLWAERFEKAGIKNKPAGRAVSEYHQLSREGVEEVAAHINDINAEMACEVEVFR